MNALQMDKLQIERLAYCLWQERGCPCGSPDDDWWLAEEIMKRRYKRFELSLQQRPLFACGIERQTR